MRSKVCVSHEGTDPQPPVGRRFDRVEAKAVNVDQVARCLDLQFHQIEEVCTTGDEFCIGI